MAQGMPHTGPAQAKTRTKRGPDPVADAETKPTTPETPSRTVTCSASGKPLRMSDLTLMRFPAFQAAWGSSRAGSAACAL